MEKAASVERASDRGASSLGFRGIPEPRQAIRVHIVAPSLVSWGLHRLVTSAGAPFDFLGMSPNLPEALPLLERSAADVVLLDFDDGYGPDEVAKLCGHVGAKLIVLTCAPDGALHDRILRAGARAIFRKHQAPGHLLKTIESVAVSGSSFAPTPLRPSASSASSATAATTHSQVGWMSLTARERETVAAVVAGASAPARVIAARLGMSEHTLRNHLNAIYSKLQVSGRLGLHALVQGQPGSWGRPC